MNLQLQRLVFTLAVSMTGMMSVHAGEQAAKKKYDFEYGTKGQPSVMPIQVFDDGANTFFQFSTEKNIPAIFAISDCGNKVLMEAIPQGNFHVVSGRFKNYALQIGSKAVTVSYGGRNPNTLNEKFLNENCDEVKESVKVPPTRAYTAVPPTLGDDAAVLKRQKLEQKIERSTGQRVFQDGAWRVTVEPLNPDTGLPANSGEQTVERAKVSVAQSGNGSAVSAKNRSSTVRAKHVASVSKKKVAAKQASTSKSGVAAMANVTASTPSPMPTESPTIAAAQTNVRIPVSPVGTAIANAPPVPPVQPPAPVVQTWDVKAGESIRNTIDQWRRVAGWEMVWSFEGDYTAQASATFQGDFQTALRNLMNALPDSVEIKIDLAANKLVYVSKKK